MIKFYFDINGYTEHEISEDIKRIEVIDRKKLQDGIDTFQKELDWRQMWSRDDAEKRLEDGWWFYVIEIDDKYIGWEPSQPLIEGMKKTYEWIKTQVKENE